jgi:hypothetical protein
LNASNPAQYPAPQSGQRQPTAGPAYPAPVQPAGGQPYGLPAYNVPAGGQMAPPRAQPMRPPVRIAQQPGAAGETLAATSSDTSQTGSSALQPMNVAAPESNLPVDLQPYVGQPGEHPLMPALRWATVQVENIRSIQDYSCVFYKRERIDGQLGGYQAMYMKVRHEPFSVYLYFKSPANIEGQEVIYVKGLNDGQLQAHTTGIKAVVGTVSLNPTGNMAMKGNRYPVTEAGILNLLERLVAVGTKDSQYGECDVQYFTSAQGVKVGGRPCTCIQVTHPVPRRNFIFYQSRIYFDEELKLPVRYESYDWPTQQGGAPLLMEEYTYQNLKFNSGFSDIDFDTRNSQYGFR